VGALRVGTDVRREAQGRGGGVGDHCEHVAGGGGVLRLIRRRRRYCE
jgi:hypothetical protein